MHDPCSPCCSQVPWLPSLPALGCPLPTWAGGAFVGTGTGGGGACIGGAGGAGINRSCMEAQERLSALVQSHVCQNMELQCVLQVVCMASVNITSLIGPVQPYQVVPHSLL